MLPQLDPTWYASQGVWMLITFCAMFLVVWRFVIPAMRATVDVRRSRIENDIQETAKLLTDNPLFVIINSYTTGLAPSAVAYASDVVFGSAGGKTAAGELGLPVRDSGLVLPCGATGRWTP